MHTSADVSWEPIPSPADAMFFPGLTARIQETDTERRQEVRILASGGPSGSQNMSYVLFCFSEVEVLISCEERIYWSTAKTLNRPHHALNIIKPSEICDYINATTPPRVDIYASFRHFCLCGGDYCFEIIASMLSIETFDSASKAGAALEGHGDPRSWSRHYPCLMEPLPPRSYQRDRRAFRRL